MGINTAIPPRIWEGLNSGSRHAYMKSTSTGDRFSSTLLDLRVPAYPE
jgi:hypothetical protein